MTSYGLLALLLLVQMVEISGGCHFVHDIAYIDCTIMYSRIILCFKQSR